MMTFFGDLTVDASNAMVCRKIQRVTGDLTVLAPVYLNIVRVDGNLNTVEGASFPLLERIGKRQSLLSRLLRRSVPASTLTVIR